MNYQIRAFQISILLHGVIIALFIIGSSFMGQYKKAIVLDFNLYRPVSDVQKGEEPAPEPIVKMKSFKPAARQNLKEKEPPRLTEESPKILPVPETPPAVKLTETRNQESHSMELGIQNNADALKENSSGVFGEAKEGLGPSSGMGNADGEKESARTKYLNDHFAYIRNKILRNVSYPDVARRMGWQGKVLLSFIIMANGSVREFKVIKSSGFAILDKSAIDTVKETAPFPRPPVEAQLVIPIIYRLE